MLIYCDLQGALTTDLYDVSPMQGTNFLRKCSFFIAQLTFWKFKAREVVCPMCDFNALRLQVTTETKGFVIVSLSVGAKKMENLGSELSPTVYPCLALVT